MSKVICDICGTTYPDTAAQCPICGCAKPSDATTVSVDTSSTPDAPVVASGSYTYVKGGRFSKSNVRKRSGASAPVDVYERENEHEHEQEHEELEPARDAGGSNRGLVIAAVLLLLAIAAVALYIFLRFFSGGSGNQPTDPIQTPGATTTTAESTQQTTTQATTQATTVPDTTASEIPCTGLTTTDAQITLKEVGHAWLLNVAAQPENTTDKITYSSSDPSVAGVTAEGRVTAVGPGQAVITITCGTQTAQCTVVCDIETVPPTTEPTVPPTESDDWRLNRDDMTLFAAGETWTLYKGTVSKSKVTFTSDDESIAVFENGKVTAVGPGTTKVHAEYNGKKITCIVRCSFKASTSSGEIGPDTGGSDAPQVSDTYTVSPNNGDATIEIGMSVTLALKDSAGNPVDVTWTASNDKYCTVSGNKVTGKAVGNVTFTTTYRGQSYECIIRVIQGAQG